VETLDEAQLTEYFGEFSVTAKAFKTLGGPDECFREFAGFFGLYALLNLNAYSIPKSRGSLLVAEWEDRRINWAVIVSKALIREVTTTRKKYPAELAYWLALIYQSTVKGGSRPSSKGVEPVTTRGEVPRATERTTGLTRAGPNKTMPAPARTTPDNRSSASAHAVPEVGTSSSVHRRTVSSSTMSPTVSFGIERVLDKPPIPTWEMEGQTKVISQTWDADTPQVPTDAAQNDPEGEAIIFV
jgi:hypothetical protein